MWQWAGGPLTAATDVPGGPVLAGTIDGVTVRHKPRLHDRNLNISRNVLFYISIRTGQFPQCWKESSIVPIPKSGDRSKPGNYQPISLLSIISKLLERHFYLLLTEYTNISHLTAPNQWGFQRGKSAVSALLVVVHTWLQALESGNEILAIFYDLRKAFDSDPHAPLLEKLQATGIHHHNILKAVRSYLTERIQRVVIWWKIISSLTSSVWSTSGLGARTLVFPNLHK